MDCYGKLYDKKDECSNCEQATYCQEAGDLKLSHSQYNDSIKAEISLSDAPKEYPEQEAHEELVKTRNAPRYSLEDLISLLRKLLEIDPLSFEYIKMKVINPAITLEQMAKQRESLERKKRALAVERLGHTFEAITGVNIARGKAKQRFMDILEEKPISREGVNKMLIKACKEHPELDLILRNKKHRK